MNSDLFITKLNNYFESRADFLSVDQLNCCFNKFIDLKFSENERVISGDFSRRCIDSFSEDNLNVAIMFLQNGTLAQNLKENSDTLLNRYTFSNFKKRSQIIFRNTGVIIRGTRYV